MFNNMHRLLKVGSRSILPLLSLTFLNIYKKDIFHIAQQTITQSSQKSSIQNISSNKSNNQRCNSGWDWPRIVQVNSPQQLSAQDIRKKVIICYQMSGIQQIDSQVVLIAHSFCDKYFGKISTPYQFVFLTPNPQAHQLYQEEQGIFVVFGRQQPKYISLKKYINSKFINQKNTQNTQKPTSSIPNFKPLFSRLLTQVNQFHELSLLNITEHIEHLNCTGRDTYQLLIIPQNQSNSSNSSHQLQQINKSKHILQLFLKNKQIWNSQIIKAIVTDQQSKIILGMNKQNIMKNKVYMIAPVNQNLLDKNKQNMFRIGNKLYSLISGEQIPQKFIFTPIPPKLSHSDYILKINIDLNQTNPQIISGIHEYMSDISIKNIPKLLNFSKSSQPIEITIQKNNYDDIIAAYGQNCMFSQQSKKELLFNSNIWKYKYTQLDQQKLKEFVDIVTKNSDSYQQKKQLQYFRSQPQTQSLRKYSKLIVGEQRKNIVQRNTNKVIFHFSKSCHSCKRFGGMYEEIANQQKQIQFYRIDNDTNKTQGLKNYNSTPVFVMYKKQYPNLQWYFKMPYFTKKLFKSFIQITKQINVMDSKKLSDHIKQHVANQKLVKETLKQFI